MANQSGGQLNLSCGFTPSAAYRRGPAPVAPSRPRPGTTWSDAYVRLHDQPPAKVVESYADVLRRQARRAP